MGFVKQFMERHPDWRSAADYRFCERLNAGQWAWEFLRRNSDYRAEWRWFHATWEKLEVRYGKPPDRDFQAWKRDPDAYKKVDDAAGDCSVDEDNVLIECWMGARWGFYKFPLDPAVDQPLIGEQLSWRPVDEVAGFIDATDADYLGTQTSKVAMGFDLDLPLRPQLEMARSKLQRRQARLRKTGQLQMRTVAGLRERWMLMLRLLDALAAGETAGAPLADTLQLRQESLEELLYQAGQLRDGGYRYLAKLPEGRVD